MLLKSKTLVIAPHPDDEVLGVGGTLLRLKEEGQKIAWLIITSINEENGWSKEQVQQREYEIKPKNVRSISGKPAQPNAPGFKR